MVPVEARRPPTPPASLILIACPTGGASLGASQTAHVRKDVRALVVPVGAARKNLALLVLPWSVRGVDSVELAECFERSALVGVAGMRHACMCVPRQR